MPALKEKKLNESRYSELRHGEPPVKKTNQGVMEARSRAVQVWLLCGALAGILVTAGVDSQRLDSDSSAAFSA
ncbi:hypothetical protein ACOMHN_020219 [Nucella lapillus]